MKKLLLLFLSVIGLAGALVAVGVGYFCPHLPARWYHKVFLGEDYVGENVSCRGYMIADKFPPGPQIGYYHHRCSDCVEVLQQIETYESPAEAEKGMRDLLARASQVREQNEQVSRWTGERIGPRAVLLFSGKDERTVIVWTVENRVIRIESSSMAHALAFERGELYERR